MPFIKNALISFLLFAMLGFCVAGEKSDCKSACDAIYGAGAAALVEVEYMVSNGQERWLDSQPGLLVSDEGLVVTWGDMRARGSRVDSVNLVLISSDEKIPASYIGKDEDTNLAFVKVGKADLPQGLAPVIFKGGDAEYGPGSEVAMVGMLPASYRSAPYLATGKLMAFMDSPLPQYMTDIPYQPGNECAPVFDMQGRPFGLAIPYSGAGIARRAGGPRTFLVYPAELIGRLVASPPVEEKEKEKKQGWLGILMGTLPEGIRQHCKLGEGGGVVVSQVFENSPAQAAGMMPGDVITKFNGKPVEVGRGDELQSFIKMVKAAPVGKRMSVMVMRNKSLLKKSGKAATELSFEKMELKITLGVRPPSALYEKYIEDLQVGITVKDITVEDRVSYSLDADVRGVIVTRVEQGSWAQLAGLSPGDIICKVDNREVPDVLSYQNTVGELLRKKPRALLLFVNRQEGTAFLVLKTRFR